MNAPGRRAGPESLAESLAPDSSPCLIPFTHDRLFETHHWWHEMARGYHEPAPFRYALGAFIQAARNVTFMLQKEQVVFSDFGWYKEWAEKAKSDPLLRWLHHTRTGIVHQQALEPESWLEFQCIGNPRVPDATDDPDDEEGLQGPLRGKISPFQCTHYHMHLGRWTDHAHEYTRHWGLDSLKGRELLDACADVYDRLDELVVNAHERLRRRMPSHKKDASRRRLPCMEDIMTHRVARTGVRDGREFWVNEPPALHRD